MSFITNLVQCLLPARCILCGNICQGEHNICAECQVSLPYLPHDPSQPTIFTLFPYEPPITRLITDLKFHHKLTHAKLLGTLMLERITSEWYLGKPLPDVILPVPLHRQRLQERGFNQSLELAKPIHHALGIPLDSQGAKRIKYTVPQSSLTATQRISNMHQAFVIQQDYTGLTVAVLDDVITTGQTLRAFCEKLKQAGAEHIHVWCIARALVNR